MACEKQCEFDSKAGGGRQCQTVMEQVCEERSRPNCELVLEPVCEPVKEQVCSDEQTAESRMTPQTR